MNPETGNCLTEPVYRVHASICEEYLWTAGHVYFRFMDFEDTAEWRDNYISNCLDEIWT